MPDTEPTDPTAKPKVKPLAPLPTMSVRNLKRMLRRHAAEEEYSRARRYTFRRVIAAQ